MKKPQPVKKNLILQAQGCKYYNQLKAEMDAAGVKVYKWSSSSSGHALAKGWVKIPMPQNEDRLSVAFHEIGHVVLRHCDRGNKSLPRYIQEFQADQFEEKLLTKYGLLTELVKRRNVWHTLSRIASAVNRGLNTDKIPNEIREVFKHIDFGEWQGKKVFVACHHKTYDGLNIILTTAYNTDEVKGKLKDIGKWMEKSTCDDSTYGKWLVGNIGQQAHHEFDNLTEIVLFHKL